MLPAGTVTFLFSDIEGSTRLLQQLGELYAELVDRHRLIFRRVIDAEGGVEVDSSGDAFFAAFPRATAAVSAAVAIQRALHAESWPGGAVVRVRMGLHTGEPALTAAGYTGLDVHRAARICAAAHGGQVLLSEATRELVQHELPPAVHLRDLGEHLLKDLNHPARLSQLFVYGVPSEFPALRTLNNRPHNLPIQPTPLIGRERDMEAVTRLLRRSDVRLVTLTGAGGTGKTRLSLQAAASVVDQFSDGVYFVPLAFTMDDRLVLPAIGQVLGVRDNPAFSIDQALRDLLVHRQLLLLLDNFEQVSTAAPVVADLLRMAPGLKVLVTSRSVLHLSGEHEYSVPPLALPTPGGRQDLAALSQYAAVELFIQRAKAVRTDFNVTETNAPAIAEICYRLDGLPLAIELAAARSKLFSPREMLARLSKPLELLTGGPRDLPDRHQTLQRAIGWSYDLLDPGEKVIFRRLAVFAGGCRLEAAEAVCSGAPVDGDIIEGIAALVDKSLLRRGEGPQEDTRFVMLETIREFGLQLLRDSGEEDAIRKAHAIYYRDLAEKAEPHLTGPDQLRWLDFVEKDHENYRLALAWAEERGEREIGLRIAAAVWRMWIVRGMMAEGRRHLEKLRRMGRPSGHDRAWVKILNALGTITQIMGDFPAARGILREVLDTSLAIGDRPGIASSLNNLSWVLFELGEMTSARALAEQARELCHDLGDRRGEASALTNLAMIAQDESRYPEALRLMEQNLAIRKEIGEQRGIGYSLGMMAAVRCSRGEYESAERLIHEALRLADEVRDKQGPAYMYSILGHMNVERCRIAEAETAFQKALPLWKEMGNKFGLGFTASGQGLVALAHGDVNHARTLLLESLELFQETGQKRSLGVILVNLGHVELARKDLPQAMARYEAGREVLQEIGDRRTLADCLMGISAVKTAEGDQDEGQGMLQQAYALLKEIGIRPTPWQIARGLAPVELAQ